MRGGPEEEAHLKSCLVSPSAAPIGLGLRWEFLDAIVERLPAAIDFLEIAPENYIGRGGHTTASLARLAARYPIVTHGLTMSLGGCEPLDPEYLDAIASFVRQVESPWHSDHLSFGASGDRMLHDLLPLSFTRKEASRVADRVRAAQDRIGTPMAVENISFYLHPGEHDIEEPEYITEVCTRADCGLLLDVNNVYVNSQNFGFDARAWLDAAPLDRVVQVHVAGHEQLDLADAGGCLVIDTHGAPVADPVLDLLGEVLRRRGPVPIVLERDQAIPPLDDLLRELDALRAIAVTALAAPRRA